MNTNYYVISSGEWAFCLVNINLYPIFSGKKEVQGRPLESGSPLNSFVVSSFLRHVEKHIERAADTKEKNSK